MFRRYYALLGLLLLGAASVRGEVEMKEVERSETPGMSSQSFVLVDRDSEGNDQVVGHVVHITAGAHSGADTLQQQFGGRRFGSNFNEPGPVMMGFGALPAVLQHLNNVNALPGQLFAQMRAQRCAMMRQFAGEDDFSLLSQRLGSRLAPMFLEAYRTNGGASSDEAEEAAVESLSADDSVQFEGEPSEGELGLFGDDVLPAMPAEADSLSAPFQLQPVAWQKRGWEGRGGLVHPMPHHHMMMMGHEGEEHPPHHHHGPWFPWFHHPHHDHEHEHEHEHEHPPHHAPWHHGWHFGESGSKGPEEMPPHPPMDWMPPRVPGDWMPPHTAGDWMDLEDTAMPSIDEDDRINWSIRDEDGRINLGLLVFMVLSAACLGVWVAGVASWISYTRHMREARSCAQFLTPKQSSDLINPLLPEGPMGSPKLYTGVEFAAEHVAKDEKFGGLQYEPLRGDK